jgi:hypothetical protein
MTLSTYTSIQYSVLPTQYCSFNTKFIHDLSLSQLCQHLFILFNLFISCFIHFSFQSSVIYLFYFDVHYPRSLIRFPTFISISSVLDGVESMRGVWCTSDRILLYENMKWSFFSVFSVVTITSTWLEPLDHPCMDLTSEELIRSYLFL